MSAHLDFLKTSNRPNRKLIACFGHETCQQTESSMPILTQQSLTEDGIKAVNMVRHTCSCTTAALHGSACTPLQHALSGSESAGQQVGYSDKEPKEMCHCFRVQIFLSCGSTGVPYCSRQKGTSGGTGTLPINFRGGGFCVVCVVCPGLCRSLCMVHHSVFLCFVVCFGACIS